MYSTKHFLSQKIKKELHAMELERNPPPPPTATAAAVAAIIHTPAVVFDTGNESSDEDKECDVDEDMDEDMGFGLFD